MTRKKYFIKKQLTKTTNAENNMPQVNASQLVSAMKAQVRYQSIPKVVLSTSNAPIHIRECMNNGTTRYIEKANSMENLYKTA